MGNAYRLRLCDILPLNILLYTTRNTAATGKTICRLYDIVCCDCHWSIRRQCRVAPSPQARTELSRASPPPKQIPCPAIGRHQLAPVLFIVTTDGRACFICDIERVGGAMYSGPTGSFTLFRTIRSISSIAPLPKSIQ